MDPELTLSCERRQGPDVIGGDMISKQKLWAPAALGLLIMTAQPADAHHSFAMFDQTRKTIIDGVVTKFVWANPHVFITVDVPGKNGGAQRYAIEAASTNMLARKGWKFSSLKGGERIRITFHPLKQSARGGLLIEARRHDGTILKQ